MYVCTCVTITTSGIIESLFHTRWIFLQDQTGPGRGPPNPKINPF